MSQYFYNVANKLPSYFSESLLKIEKMLAEQITEIRLKCERPVVLCTFNNDYVVDENGNAYLADNYKSNIKLLYCEADILENIFLELCSHSIYTYENDIKNGFITLSGGHRVGIAGKAVFHDGVVSAVKNITSLNIRIARCLNIIIEKTLTSLLSLHTPRILILGEPCSGKTTLLRSISKYLSEKDKKVCVIDEREEIWPQYNGKFIFVPPLRCDVLSGFIKGDGALMALRSLSPNVIICDEIGASEDATALLQSLNSGVGIIATAHAESFIQATSRPQLNSFFSNKIFEYVVVLCGGEQIGKIKEVIKIADDC